MNELEINRLGVVTKIGLLFSLFNKECLVCLVHKKNWLFCIICSLTTLWWFVAVLRIFQTCLFFKNLEQIYPIEYYAVYPHRTCVFNNTRYIQIITHNSYKSFDLHFIVDKKKQIKCVVVTISFKLLLVNMRINLIFTNSLCVYVGFLFYSTVLMLFTMITEDISMSIFLNVQPGGLT